MRGAAAWALVALLLLGTYHGLRYIAARCAGPGCDVYIPVSLVLPVVCWLAAVVSGVVSLSEERRSSGAATDGHTRWLGVLSACTLLGLAGPPLGLAAFGERPDLFVAVGSACVASVPLGVLGWVWAGRRGRNTNLQ